MLTKKIMFVSLLIGCMSGFNLMLSGNTLNFWLSKENIDIRTIGVFALITLPYSINFLWAPIFDTKKLPILSQFFGQRLSWIILIQVCLSVSVYLMSKLNPLNQLMLMAICGTIIAFFASAEDALLGALRSEMVDADQQGEISGMYVFGYRIGMLISSSGAIYISQYMQWHLVYELFSFVIIIFPILLIICLKNFIPVKIKNIVYKKKSIFESLFLNIIKPIGNLKYIILILVFLILYRLPDNFITMMINPFLLHLGYNEFEISTAGKLFGVSSAIIGGLIGSYIMRKRNLFNSLLFFGTIHAITHILFVVHEIQGKNIYLFLIVTVCESVTGGMTMAAYIAFIASLCKGKFRATQYSFLSSMMGLSRSILPTISGYIVLNFGWKIFYIFTTLATLPSLILILYLKKMQQQETQNI